jgi:RimJ/RimL family protein N-acetyltransferase
LRPSGGARDATGSGEGMTLPDIRIETERLLLRLPQAEDFDRFAELVGDPVAARYIGGHLPRGAAWRKFLQQPGAWAIQGFGMFSFIDRDSGRWLGQGGPWRPDGWPGNEIGYMLHPDAWGKGYATEGLAAAIDWALGHLAWNEFIHCIAPENTASQNVARRLGSTYRGEGRLPPPFHEAPCGIWGQTRAQWLARKEGGR